MDLAGKLGLSDVDVSGKRVLMRVDFNVPMQGGRITDKTRIVAALPSVRDVLTRGARSVVLMSHLGRPDGRVVAKDSLRPVAEAVQELLGQPVQFLSDCVGAEVEQACADAAPGAVIMLENLRFHAEEEGAGIDATGAKFKPTEAAVAAFRQSLSRLGDVFVNDAFGTAHRAHSSMAGVQLETRAAGFLMKKELDAFAAVLQQPKRPLLAILGGAKVSDKIKLIFNLIDKADELIIGGAMAFTFKKVLNGLAIGSSLYDAEGAKLVPGIMEKAKARGVAIHLPVDYVLGDRFANDCNVSAADDESGIPDGWAAYDIGPKSIAAFTDVVRRCHTVMWNGPMGVFEFDKFLAGTKAVMQAVVDATAGAGLVSIIGGGDTASCAEKLGVVAQLTHVSTGGGASLELLEGRDLPGVSYLSSRS